MYSILFAILVGLTYLFGENFSSLWKKYRIKLISFSAGVSITYIFVDLFPKFAEGVVLINEALFFAVLIGFMIFYLIEKFIYLNNKSRRKRDLKLEHIFISSIYHFIIGILIQYFTIQNFLQGLFFTIPIIFYTLASTLPVEPPKYEWIKIILSSSTLLGVIFAVYIPLSTGTFFSLMGLIIGALLYTVIRHSIPRGKEGEPWLFFIGAIIYSIVLLMF